MDKLSLYDKILFPVVTEKSTNLSEQNKIIFKVPSKANKKNLKSNIEKIFKVEISQVNTCVLPIKTRRVGRFIGKRAKYKKAYVKLKEGDTINDLFN